MGMLRVFRGENRRYYLQFRLNGGEGGIRTLGTGFSPYNGLAIISADEMPSNLKHLQSRSRTETHRM
jgi:hypothetical protein